MGDTDSTELVFSIEDAFSLYTNLWILGEDESESDTESSSCCSWIWGFILPRVDTIDWLNESSLFLENSFNSSLEWSYWTAI